MFCLGQTARVSFSGYVVPLSAMGSLNKLILSARTPLVEFRRFRGKINIQRPQKQHYLRQLFTDFCKPIYPKKQVISNTEKCYNVTDRRKEKIDNPFEHILAKECLNWFNHSKMITFYHLNPYPGEDQSKVYAALYRENMFIRRYGRSVLELALKGTNFEGVLPLFISHTNIIFSEKVQVAKLFEITKKAHPMILLAGIVDGKLLSKNELVAYSKINSIVDVQSQLCQILESSSSNLVELLTLQQSELVSSLDSYVQMKQADAENKNDNTPTNINENEGVKT